MKDNVMKDSSMFNGTEKKKSKKLDYMIYLLAVVSLVLMMVVIFKNNKTTTEILEPEKTSIASSQSSSSVLSKLEESNITPESFIQKNEEEKEALKATEDKNVIQEEQLLVDKTEKNIETTKVEDKIVKKEEIIKEPVKENNVVFQEKQVKNSYKSDKEEQNASYNWKVLKRYPAQPDSHLKTVSSYKVKSGDSLWKIAQKHNVKTINLVAVNKIANPDYLYPGQIIMISNM